MRAVDIIIKKRDRNELTQEEIEFFIQGYTRGEITDYQASAWAMAVLLNGMTPREITDLTLAMAHSGEVLDLSEVAPLAVDKHSTGGVGDKTTLVVEPIVAACGLPVGKMSGRGLGFSGGTIDKLESIPGFRANLSTQEFLDQLRSIGLVLTGQSADLAPADGKLYALRDVTGTVQALPLIASSIMSKKIAAGARAIVLDVKIGSGAFMDTLEQAQVLAQTMVMIGKMAGRKVTALLSDMNQPLGYAVGNALELLEAIAMLNPEVARNAWAHGLAPDFHEHCLIVAAHLLVLGGKVQQVDAGRKLAETALESGQAWEKFRALVIAQGGQAAFIDQPERLPQAQFIETVPAPRAGHLAGIQARAVGESAVLLGGGRTQKSDPIDYAVGIVVHHKVGQAVKQGEALFTIHANAPDKLAEARQRLLAAHTWQDTPVEALPLFYGVVDSSMEGNHRNPLIHS